MSSPRFGRRPNNRRWSAFNRVACWCLALTSTSAAAWAENPSAPALVQGHILTRLLPYDRSFEHKVKSEVVVLLLQRAGNADSVNAVGQVQKVLTDIGAINGLPLRIETVPFTSAQGLAALCTARGANAVYISPSFADSVRDISHALDGSGVLSFAAVEDYVPGGIVVGVEVVAGKPKMSINLTQARAQGIDFPSGVLSLARIY